MSELYTDAYDYKLIYVFSIPYDDHKGLLKIGETTLSTTKGPTELPPNCEALNAAAKTRISEYTKTANIPFTLHYTELALRKIKMDDGTNMYSTFSDKDVHRVLDNASVRCQNFWEGEDKKSKSEWYETDLDTAKAAIAAVKANRSTLAPAENTATVPAHPIELRKEQSDAVRDTKHFFSQGDRALWNCKMRFGKTATAYQLIKDYVDEGKFLHTIVVTHRPVVKAGWGEDHDKIFGAGSHHQFLIKDTSAQGKEYDAALDADNDRKLRQLVASGTAFTYFTSIQDLWGSKAVEGKFDKNNAVFSIPWDLIIYDEAHEGTQAYHGTLVRTALERPKQGITPKVLSLSGTPYNIEGDYEDNVVTWDYVMEQQAKAEFARLHPLEHNPYADLPELKILTFDMGKAMPHAYRYDGDDIAFNFREFFRTWTGDPIVDFRPVPPDAAIGDFVHEADVRSFLDLISTEDPDTQYPFSRAEWRDLFRHTFWMVPGVKEARAFSKLLQQHPVFGKYEVVNVAGDGDVEKPYDEALSMVENAIAKNDYTITISCGRLTTGVTVREWSAVMMLTGSSSSSAMSYMQTIFRVQSAGSINGKQKQVAYVFDFAPDRTLKVISDVYTKKRGRTQETDRTALGEFLNFCPVISVSGTEMVNYDVRTMMRTIKKISVEKVIKSGFEDDTIYNDETGVVLSAEDKEFLNHLSNVVSGKSKSKKQTAVVVNDQGMTKEQYNTAQRAKNKPKRERTPEEEEALEREKELKKQRENVLRLLRSVSIRLPMLIYGAEKDFNETIPLAEFVEIVDDESWAEFMPDNLKKSDFLKMIKYYDVDVVEGASLRIRRLARQADDLMPLQRAMKIAEIFSYFRNPDKETVLTPWRVVNMHLGDTIGGYNFYEEGYPQDGLLDAPRWIDHGEVTAKTFSYSARLLEMNSKSGLYPLYLTCSLYLRRLPKDENLMTPEEAWTVWDRCVQEQVYVLCKTPMAVNITHRTLCGYSEKECNAIHLSRLLDRMEDKPRLARKLTNPATWGKEGERMKFTSIVGNPPYMQMDGGAQASARPIYQHFIQTARSIVPQYLSFVVPTRWYAGGKGLDEFRDEMLTDRHIEELHDFPDPDILFPGTNIRGGVCYFLWSNNYDNRINQVNVVTHEAGRTQTLKRDLKIADIDVFIRNGKAISIMQKVLSATDFKTLMDEVSPRKPFGLDGNIVATKAFCATADSLSQPVKCYGKAKSVGYIESSGINNHREWIDCWKVFMPYANNIGTELSDDNQNTFVGAPGTVCTETFILVGQGLKLTEKTADNLSSYLRTTFARFLHSLPKVSQHGTAKTYRFVPLQDFSKPWTDAELYTKYGLTDDEIAFVESMIKPME